MPIYTKKGDKGDTGLVDKTKGRIDKDSQVVEALGALDELNSFLGVCRSYCDNPKRDVFVKEIQNNLFNICSIIAGSDIRFSKTHTTKLEKEIDKITKGLPKLSSFVYSSGSQFATHLMYARSMSRRAERRAVSLDKIEKLHPNILQYLNRLSDMIFMLFREANFDSGTPEEGWKI